MSFYTNKLKIKFNLLYYHLYSVNITIIRLVTLSCILLFNIYIYIYIYIFTLLNLANQNYSNIIKSKKQKYSISIMIAGKIKVEWKNDSSFIDFCFIFEECFGKWAVFVKLNKNST